MFDLKQALHSKAKNILLVAALLSSLVLLACSIRWTSAEVFKARAAAILYNVNQLADRHHGKDLLIRARNLNPYDAELPLYQAHFSSYSRKAARDQPRPSGKHTRPIDSFYRQALAIRPHSGHLWAQYARAQFESSYDLQETFVTLEKAMKLAPYQPSVIFTAMQIGLFHWHSLNNPQKQQLGEAIDFLLDKNSRKVINIAIAHNLAEKLRALLKQPAHIQYLDQALIKKEKHSKAGQ